MLRMPRKISAVAAAMPHMPAPTTTTSAILSPSGPVRGSSQSLGGRLRSCRSRATCASCAARPLPADVLVLTLVLPSSPLLPHVKFRRQQFR